MSILLTGATGYIGSSVLRLLIEEGHDVTALVRNPRKASEVEAAGATALLGDLTDTALLQAAAGDSDGVINLAAPTDASVATTTDGVVTAVLAGLARSGKPYVHTSGIWLYGSNADITEASPADPVDLVAWRVPVDRRVRAADGVRTSVIVPTVVFGHGKGIPALISQAPTTGEDSPALRLVGDGSQHWGTVHVDDLAALYVLALESAEAGSLFIGASGQNPTVRELGEAAASARHLTGVAPETVEETRSRLGADFADALLLDQQATGTGARIDLGWEPNGPSIIDEFTTGSYAPAD